MGFLSRMFIPRGGRRAVHPGRAVRRAATPRAVKRVQRAVHPIDNAVYGVQRKLKHQAPGSRGKRTVNPESFDQPFDENDEIVGVTLVREDLRLLLVVARIHQMDEEANADTSRGQPARLD